MNNVDPQAWLADVLARIVVEAIQSVSIIWGSLE
jgi:hypothetical protein